jgi:hypothetical protein
MKTPIAAAGFALALSSAAAQTTSVERQILAARDTVWRAWFANDTTVLRRFIPPAAATLDDTRWSSRRDIVDGAQRFAESNVRLLDVKFEGTRIEQIGNSALVRASYRVVLTSGTKRDTMRGRATELFVRHGGTWINPYWQLESKLDGFGRDIPLPDTLGANFSIADSAAKMAKPTDYDRLLGTWEFRFQVRVADGSFLPPFDGHWTFDKKPGGGLIEDRWRPDDASTPSGQSLYTYRTFDPRKHVWFMLGTSSDGGEVQPGLTWSDGQSLLAIQRNGNALSRIRYSFLSDDHFVWRSDRSEDGGRTWLRDAGTMEARRIGR